MVRKILQVGSSAGITLSQEALEVLAVKIGDKVDIYYDTSEGAICIQKIGKRSTSKQLLSKSDKELLEWVKRFHKIYGPVLKKLADKD